MFLRIKAITTDQHFAAFDHRAANDQSHFLVEDRLTNGGVAGLLAEVRGDRMTGVQGKEFALDERHQVVGQFHSGDFRQSAFKLSLIDNPLAEGFYRHFQRIGSTGGGWRNNAVYGGIDKTDMRFNPHFLFFRQRVEYVLFELAGAAHHIFTGDDIQRIFVALLVTQNQTFRDVWRNFFQYGRAHGGGD